jgi:hypothetical protein
LSEGIESRRGVSRNLEAGLGRMMPSQLADGRTH